MSVSSCPARSADASRAAAGLLREWLSSGVLIRDRMPALYLYEQAGRRRRVAPARHHRPGPAGLARAAGILPHEDVMPGLVAGRRELMAATQANLEPIFLIYDGEGPGLPRTTARRRGSSTSVAAERAPLVSVTTEDGVTHRLWRLATPASRPPSPPTWPGAAP